MSKSLELLIAKDQFKVLKTPRLRQQIKRLESEILLAKTNKKNALAGMNLEEAEEAGSSRPKGSHRHRGVRCSGLVS